MRYRIPTMSLAALLLAPAGMLPAQEARARTTQEIVEQIRGGGMFTSAQELVQNGTIRPEAVAVLRQAIRTGDWHTRAQSVRALAAAGQLADPLSLKGVPTLRGEALAVIVEEAFRERDVARDYAIDAMLSSTPVEAIREHERALVEALERAPNPELLLLVAKGKLVSARPVVNRLMESGRWAGEEATRIAAAALGNRTIEGSLVTEFTDTQDAERKAHLAKSLGYVGTDAALRALASELRSPLIVGAQSAFARSVRVDILEALRFNFPEEDVLFTNRYSSDADYERAELFCAQRFGTSWSTSRPVYLTVRAEPLPMPRPPL